MAVHEKHIVEISKVTKRFPGVIALRDVSLGFLPGEVHAVIGENGAGKSTLMNILAGDLQPSEGDVLIAGQPTKLRTALDSRAAGIVVVYQELALCPTMSVADNIMMSDMATERMTTLVPRAEMRKQARLALSRLGMGNLDPDSKVSQLSIVEKQLVEIAGAIRQNARVLVLDEPNSALSRRESERLFDVVRQLREEGVTVIYVSHHLKEVLDIADRVTVMRDGRKIETLDNENLTEARLIRGMVGRDVAQRSAAVMQSDEQSVPAVMTVTDLVAPGLDNISFSVGVGEILGIGGLPDSGKDGLGEAIFGLVERQGRIEVAGSVLKSHDPVGAIGMGVSFVPADRRGASGLLAMSVADNVVSASLGQFSVMGLLKRGAIRRKARAQVARLDARISHLGQKLGTLSGGNQQKIILGRSLVTNPCVLILHEPTRGIDVGAKAEIYSILAGIASEGVGVVIISSEIPELIMNAMRVLVFRNGQISGELIGAEIEEETILARAMTS